MPLSGARWFKSSPLRFHYMEEKTQGVQNAVFEFTFQSFDKHRRSVTWYIGALIIAGLLLLYAIYTANFLFAVLILIIGFIIFIHDLRDPVIHDCIVTEGGIFVDDQFLPYSDFESFWIVYDPPVKNLYLTQSGITKSHLTIPIGDADPIEVRRWLRRVVLEDLERNDEPASETIGRILKI